MKLDQHEEPTRDFIQRVENGDPAAEEQLWSEFFEKLLRYLNTRVRVSRVPTGLIDEEAVAVSALESVFKCARQGRLQEVQDWSELSQLLFKMTGRKFIDHLRRAMRQKSFPGTPLKELATDSTVVMKDEIPETIVEFNEQLARLIALLPDELHRQIAVFKLAGYSLSEISEKVNRAVPTVNRKWQNIRRIWGDELKGSD